MPKTRSASTSSSKAKVPTKKSGTATGRSRGVAAPSSSRRRTRSNINRLSQYAEDLISLPTSRIGMAGHYEAINERVKKIQTDQALSRNDCVEESLSSLLQSVSDIPGFGTHGKVGLYIRKETLERLEEALLEMHSGGPEEPGSGLNTEGSIVDQAADDIADILPPDFPAEEELTKDTIQETFEGIDRDLLGVNSQAALDRISAFVTKTIADNHPSKMRHGGMGQPPIRPSTTANPSTQPSILPTVSAAKQSSKSTSKAPPLKFAFLSVVATYDAKCPVSLEDLQAKVRTVTFDPTWFHSAVLTFPKSECRAAIFQNGKFVVTGVTTIKTALIATRNILEILRLCGCTPEISKRNFRAKNLTALMELGVNIDIAGFAEKHQHNTYMDQDTFGAVTHFPEKSPSTIHRGGLGLCMLIFATGKIVMVGGKTEKQMISVFRDKTLSILKPFAFGWN